MRANRLMVTATSISRMDSAVPAAPPPAPSAECISGISVRLKMGISTRLPTTLVMVTHHSRLVIVSQRPDVMVMKASTNSGDISRSAMVDGPNSPPISPTHSGAPRTMSIIMGTVMTSVPSSARRVSRVSSSSERADARDASGISTQPKTGLRKKVRPAMFHAAP